MCLTKEKVTRLIIINELMNQVIFWSKKWKYENFFYIFILDWVFWPVYGHKKLSRIIPARLIWVWFCIDFSLLDFFNDICRQALQPSLINRNWLYLLHCTAIVYFVENFAWFVPSLKKTGGASETTSSQTHLCYWLSLKIVVYHHFFKPADVLRILTKI